MLLIKNPLCETESRCIATGVPENHLDFHELETQALVGQYMHRLQIDEDFVKKNGYRCLFDQAFADVALSACSL
ncbi:hypothetical protein [Nonlabens sp.]|uniref:hypothetical protein n=1 Tax=Nonlabens sp. TaxID=1888209 RepID=UPI001BCC696F|nr:hypothetical protein [Nonlabens sp.]